MTKCTIPDACVFKKQRRSCLISQCVCLYHKQIKVIDMETTASRKRKRCHVHQEEHLEEEEDEEEKIDRFFKLIKSIREAREWLLLKEESANVLIKDSSEINERKKKLSDLDSEKQRAAVWKPSFQLEDFMDDHDHQPHHLINNSLLAMPSTHPSRHLQGSPKSSTQEKMDGLDLKLAL